MKISRWSQHFLCLMALAYGWGTCEIAQAELSHFALGDLCGTPATWQQQDGCGLPFDPDSCTGIPGCAAIPGCTGMPCSSDGCGLPCGPDSCTGIGCDACEPQCWWQSSTLTGNWGGVRTDLQDSGVTFKGDVTQFYYGVTSGGTQQQFAYSGHGDYVVNIDGGKAGIQEGLFIKLRAEHRFGETISTSTGALLPATILPELPVPSSDQIFLTNVLFTQMLSEKFGIFFGKMDMLDGDSNAYASGRGKTQFSNIGFVVNPVLLRLVPYSTLAAGYVYLHNGQPMLTFSVLNPLDSTTSSGFEKLFTTGAVIASELKLPTYFLEKSGHFTLGGVVNTRRFTSLGQDPRILTGDVPIATQNGSWGAYANFDQTLVNYGNDPTRGWGLFGRAGVGDAQTNPLAYFLSLGIGGNSPLTSRKNDTFGLGYYYLGASSQLGPILGNLGDGHAYEAFYNLQVTPSFNLTTDFQVISPGRDNIDTALVVGLRANIAL